MLNFLMIQIDMINGYADGGVNMGHLLKFIAKELKR
jgi:hypothetical protein